MPHAIGFVDNSSHDRATVAFIDLIHDLLNVPGSGWEVVAKDTFIVVFRGEGFTGEESIYVGLQTSTNWDSDIFNFRAGTFTGYLPEEDFQNQPGATNIVFGHNERIDYWLTWNKQRISFALKVGTPVYGSCYLGKFMPYARPSQFPYPLVNFADHDSFVRFSSTSPVMPYKGNRSNALMRDLNGNWIEPRIWPYDDTSRLAGTSGALRDLGGNYDLVPVELFTANEAIWGTLDGIYFVSGFDNTVENLIVIDGVEYFVMQNLYRTGFGDYYAIRMDP